MLKTYIKQWYIVNLEIVLSTFQVDRSKHMQVCHSLFNDDLKVTHLGPNYHWQPISSCSHPILYAKTRPEYMIYKKYLCLGCSKLICKLHYWPLVSYTNKTLGCLFTGNKLYYIPLAVLRAVGQKQVRVMLLQFIDPINNQLNVLFMSTTF